VSDSERHQSVSATCKVCGTRVTPGVKFAGRQVECPDCFSTIELPTLEQHNENERIKKQQDDVVQPEAVETYGLAPRPVEPTEPPPEKRADRAAATQEESNEVDDSDDDIFKNAPASSDSAERPRRKKVRRKKAAKSRAAATEDAAVAGVSALEALAEIKRHEVPDPPKNLFFSNVFQFPWSTVSALQRWGFLSFAILLNLLMVAFLLYLREELGAGALIPTAFIALAQFALFVWAAAYAAATTMSIIQDTSAGNDEVLGWPEGGVGEWFSEFLAMLVLFVFSGFFAYLIVLPISFVAGTFVPYIFIVHLMIIPASLLSGLDAESILFPISSMISRSFKTLAKSWLQVTFLSSAVLVGCSFVVSFTTSIQPFAAAVINAPLIAATVFIYARLLGRMAYTIGQNAPDVEEDGDDDDEERSEKRKSRKRKVKNQDADEKDVE
jgi:hypothetical protein